MTRSTTTFRRRAQIPTRLTALGLLAAIALVGYAPPSEAAPRRVIIAVFGVQDPSGRFTASELEQLTTYFATELARGEVYHVVPQSQLRDALKNLKAGSYSACYDEQCQIEIGREVAAEKSVMTQILAVGSKCAVTSTLWDLRKAASERATRVKVNCDPDSLVAGLEQTATDLKADSTMAAAPAPAPNPSAITPAPAPGPKPAPAPAPIAESITTDPAPPAVVTQKSDAGPSLALPITVLAVGVAGAVVGTIFLVKAAGHASNAEDPSFVGGQVEIGNAETSQTIGLIGLSAGLGLTALGTVLFIADASSDSPPEVAATPLVLGHGGGLAFSGVF
jgi:hypothetical protein